MAVYLSVSNLATSLSLTILALEAYGKVSAPLMQSFYSARFTFSPNSHSYLYSYLRPSESTYCNILCWLEPDADRDVVLY